MIAIRLFLLLGRPQAAGDVGSLETDVASLRTEVAGFRADLAKAMTAIDESASGISGRVKTMDLAIGNLSIGLAEKPLTRRLPVVTPRHFHVGRAHLLLANGPHALHKCRKAGVRRPDAAANVPAGRKRRCR